MSNYKFETLQLHVGQEQADPATDSRAVPIYQTTSYVFRNSQHAADRFGLPDAGNIYGRLTNSTQDVFEKRIAALEGGVAALAVASGAAAITYTIEALAQGGDHIVAQKTIYGGSYNLLEHTLTHFGITTTFVNAHDLAEVESAIQPNTKAIYLETLGNPNSDIPDIDAIAAIAHKHGLPLVIDNTFGTPYLIRPLSTAQTSWSTPPPSSSAATAPPWAASSWTAASSTGRPAASSPISRAQPQLPRHQLRRGCRPRRLCHLHPRHPAARYRRYHLSVQRLAAAAGHRDPVPAHRAPRREHQEGRGVPSQTIPRSRSVNHPSLPDHPDHSAVQEVFPNGGAFHLHLSHQGRRGRRPEFIDNLKIFSLLANVADAKSLVIHPASTTHSQLNDAELWFGGVGKSNAKVYGKVHRRHLQGCGR